MWVNYHGNLFHYLWIGVWKMKEEKLKGKSVKGFINRLRNRGYSETTLDRYILYAKKFPKPKELSQEKIDSLLANSGKLMRTVLRSYVKEYLQIPPWKMKVPEIRGKKKVRRKAWLEEEEYHYILRKIPETFNWKKTKKRVLLLTRLLYETGARIGEILPRDKDDLKTLKKVDVDWKENKIELETQKGGPNRTVFISDVTKKKLRRWVKQYRERKIRVFDIIRQTANHNYKKLDQELNQDWKNAKKLTPHLFRHTRVQRLRDQGARKEIIFHYLGWKISSPLGTYGDVREKEVKKYLEFL